MRKQAVRIRKNILVRAGTGATVLAIAGTLLVVPVYAAPTQETYDHEAPNVSDGETYSGYGGVDGNTTFEIEEVDARVYVIRVIVMEDGTTIPISDAKVTILQPDGTKIKPRNGTYDSVTGADGSLSFRLKAGVKYTLYVTPTKNADQYESYAPSTIEIEKEDTYQDWPVYLKKIKKPDPTEPIKPTEPTRPDPTEPTKPDHGGGGGGGNGGSNSSTSGSNGGTTTPETGANPSPSPDVQPEPQKPENNGNQNPSGPTDRKPDAQNPSEPVSREDNTTPENRDEYILPGKDGELGTDDDVRVKPDLDADGNNRSYLREDGAVVLPDGGTVTYADGEMKIVPPGTIVLPDGTIIYPDEDAVEVDGEPHGVHFGDCWFHWLELLVMIIMTLASMRRLLQIRDIHKELDEMEEKRDNTEE